MTLTTRIFKRLHDIAARHTTLGDRLWHEAVNRTASRQQRLDPLNTSDAVCTQALGALRDNGLATFHVSQLTGGDALFEAICLEEAEIVGRHRDVIEQRRASLGRAGDATKKYIVSLVPGSATALSFEDPSVRLTLHPQILGIANAFLGLYAQLRCLEYWYTLADRHQTPKQSQLWHRDFEDIALVKLFLYTSDVDDNSGPLSFVKGTHTGALRWTDPPDIARGLTVRADDQAMERIVPRDQWFTGTGRAGTIIMAATKGYHKGGLATVNDRRLLYAVYLSPWSPEKLLPKSIDGVPAAAHPAIRFAAGNS